MTTYGRIETADGYSYQITPDDVLWLARSVSHEGGNRAATIWTYFQRQAALRRTSSLASLVLGHSQPVNPAWRRDGAKCRPGGPYYGRDECSERRLAARDRAATMPWEQIPAETRNLVLAAATAQLPNPVPKATDFADARVSTGFLGRNPGAGIVLQDGNWYLYESRSARWPANYVSVRLGDRVASDGISGGGSSALFAVLLGAAAGIGFYFYRRRKKAGSLGFTEDDRNDWVRVPKNEQDWMFVWKSRGDESVGYVVDGCEVVGSEIYCHPEVYAHQRATWRRRKGLSGVQEDVEETLWNADGEWHDSFWVEGPDRRSKGGEDGPRDRRRGASKIGKDRSGLRTIAIDDEYDCNDLNRSIKRLVDARDGWGRLLAKYPNPDVFDNVMLPPDPYEPPEHFGPDVIEDSEFNLNERIDVLRAIARANGCSHIAGLRR